MWVYDFSLIVERSWIILCSRVYMLFNLFPLDESSRYLFSTCNITMCVIPHFCRYVSLHTRSKIVDQRTCPFIVLDLLIYSLANHMYECVKLSPRAFVFNLKTLSIDGLIFGHIGVLYLWMRLNIEGNAVFLLHLCSSLLWHQSLHLLNFLGVILFLLICESLKNI